MMHVRLSAAVGPGRSHGERITAAQRIMANAMIRHGTAILGVGIYGTTAVGLDGPYSDLDMTFITRIDIGHKSKVRFRHINRQGFWRTCSNRSGLLRRGGGSLGEHP